MKTVLTILLLALTISATAQWDKIPSRSIAWVSQDNHPPADTIITSYSADTLTISVVLKGQTKSDRYCVKKHGKLKHIGKKEDTYYGMEFGGVYLFVWPVNDVERVFVYCPKL